MKKQKNFDPIRSLARDAITLSSQENKPGSFMHNADHLVEHSVEFAAVLGAIFVAIEMGKNQLVNINLTANEKLRDTPGRLEAFSGNINRLKANLPSLTNQIQNLRDAWRSAYHKSRIETYTTTETTCTGSGSDRKCRTVNVEKKRTVYYWDEPNELRSAGIDRNVIDSWLGTISNINNNFQRLAHTAPEAPTFKHGEESYTYTATPVDQSSRNNIRTVGFGGAALAFAFYEEIITHLSDNGIGIRALNDSLSHRYIKRRSFLKLGGVGVMGAIITKIQNDVVALNSNIHDLVFDYARNVEAQRELPAPNSFGRFVGMSPDSVKHVQDSISNIADNSLSAGSGWTEDWAVIQPRLSAVADNVEKAIADFEYILNYTGSGDYSIPQSLTDAMNNVWAHEQISNYAGGLNASANNTALLEVLVLVFGLLGVSVGIETLNEISQSVLTRLSDEG